jgi:hypothetical protein
MTSSDRGQSTPLGVALLLGLTLIGTTAVVAFGSVALSDTQETSELAGAEQSMTLFDSQTSQVALGDSWSQTISFGQTEGLHQVNPNAGNISIVQIDCDDGADDEYDSEADDLGENDTYLLNTTSLGAVTYKKGDRSIAYQGGGVWRKADDGGSTMVSPPEFHYRGATLTLPVVLTRGSGAGSGDVSATVTKKSSRDVFPNKTDSFPSKCSEARQKTNPVTDGRVIVRVESRYYDAWGKYFETRTEGNVSYYHSEQVVTVELVSLGKIGEFGMPGDDGSITVSGASEDHSTKDYSITLRPDDSDSADFNNLQWSMYVEEGDQQFEMHLKKSGSGSCSDIKADLTIYYSEDGGATYQGWHADNAYEAECEDLDGDGDDEIYLEAVFVDDKNPNDDYVEIETDDVNLTNTSLSSNDLEHFNPNGDLESSTTFDGHGDWEPETYSAGDEETVDRLVNHYFAELPSEFDLTVDDKNSDTVNEEASSGELVTGGSGRYVTFLHVTENEVEVDLD